jgi:8-oxo-dGTP diphosphatase
MQRVGPQGAEYAVVHRKRYADAAGGAGDYSLPKGKVNRGESIEQAALREVREETGCTARVVGPPDFVEYEVRGVPKIVVVFPMVCDRVEPVADTGEVNDVLWLDPQSVLQRLTYEGEREIVRRALER